MSHNVRHVKHFAVVIQAIVVEQRNLLMAEMPPLGSAKDS